MKLYDRNGNFVGTVRKEELVNTEEAIMPVSIKVTPAREIALPDGFLIMGIGSLVAGIAFLLTFLSDRIGFSKDLVENLAYFGIYGTRAAGFVPLAAFIQLAAGIILIQRYRGFLVYVFIHLVFIASSVTNLVTGDLHFPSPVLGVDASLDMVAMAVLAILLYRHRSIKIFIVPLVLKTLFYMIFSAGYELKLDSSRILMSVYYLVEMTVWLYIFLHIRKREKNESI